MIIHETSRVAIIATFNTRNRKTGDMVQIWILDPSIDPVSGRRSGRDAATICRGCPLASGNGCYVAVHQAPLAIWRKYKAGGYPPLDLDAFNGKAVRFGAYGNPSLIPIKLVRQIAARARVWTGYFHDWHEMSRSRADAYSEYFMASTESEERLAIAECRGYRTFHVSATRPVTHIECVAESHGRTCEQCGLCRGNRLGAKSIWIKPHGYQKNKVGAS